MLLKNTGMMISVIQIIKYRVVKRRNFKVYKRYHKV